MTIGHRIHQHGVEIFYPQIILDGTQTNATCGHRHKSAHLAEKCAKKFLLPKWREIVAHHIETRTYRGGVGVPIFRLWYGTADGKIAWENFSPLEN